MSLPFGFQNLAAAAGGNSTGGAGAAGGAAPPPKKVNSVELVLHADIILLVVLGVFALAVLPRAIAHFSRASEWRLGFMMRSGQPKGPYGSGSLPRVDTRATTDSSMPLYGNEKSAPTMSVSHPPHIPAWSSMVHPLWALMGTTVYPGYSLGQVILMAGYFGVMAYVSSYKNDIFSGPNRLGFVATSQIPVVFAFGTKNNLVGFFTGVGYEKLNYLHRWSGRICALAANLHAISYFYKFHIAGTPEALQKPYIMFGVIALVGADVLAFMSFSWLRSKSYNLFLWSHFVGLVMFPLALCYHEPVCIPWVIAAAGIYALDRLLRLIKTRICTASIRPIPELSLTRVEVPGLNSGWRAGQHVRVRILSTKMGLLGWSEVHPFTIASCSDGHEGMVLMCKKAGTWTKNLYEMASKSRFEMGGSEGGGDVKMIVEGPYGGPCHTVAASYSGVMLVAGGSGITFALGVASELVQKRAEGKSRAKVIDIVWTVQDPASLHPLASQFLSLIQQATTMTIRVSVHYTRATFVDPTKNYLPPGITLSPGRPRLGNILDMTLDSALALGNGYKGGIDPYPSGVLVGVCGPGGLGNEVRRCVANVDPTKRSAVSGVELHEEVFGW